MTVTGMVRGQTEKRVSFEDVANTDNADLYRIAKNFARETDSSLFGHRITRFGPDAIVTLWTD